MMSESNNSEVRLRDNTSANSLIGSDVKRLACGMQEGNNALVVLQIIVGRERCWRGSTSSLLSVGIRISAVFSEIDVCH